MLENENLVTEVTENVETATEETVEQVETPKVYTEEEFNQKFNEGVGKKLARQEAKIRKEYEKKYGGLMDVLRAGTGKESVEEVRDTFAQFYESKGMYKPTQEPTYSEKDIEVLAKADADTAIGYGNEEVEEELDRLTNIGFDNMTARDKAYYKVLAEHYKTTERQKELSKIGVTEDVYNSKEFQDFANKFAANTPIADVYNIYKKTQPKQEFKTAGSMKSNSADNGGLKDYYSFEEAQKFSKKELDENPKLFEIIKQSMPKWSKK